MEETAVTPSRKSKSSAGFYKTIRLIHLYTGLFLLPWILIYASSAFVLNHRPLFDAHLKSVQEFEPHSKHDFTPGESFPKEPKEQARAILQHLGMDGPHSFKGKAEEGNFLINRPTGGGHYRIKWLPGQNKLIVERRPFSIVNLLNFLHFTAGFNSNYLRRTVWAIVVDLFALSMWIWGISGIVMWLRPPGGRFWGVAAVIAGWLLFALLGLLLYF